MRMAEVIERPAVFWAVAAIIGVLGVSAVVHLVGGPDLLGDVSTPLFGLVIGFWSFDDDIRERRGLSWAMRVAGAILVVGGVIDLLG